MMPMDTSASHQQEEALDTAEGARFRPMRTMMGPVTTGGREVHHPLHADGFHDDSQDNVQQARYHDAAAGILKLSPGSMVAYMPLSHGSHGGKPPR